MSPQRKKEIWKQRTQPIEFSVGGRTQNMLPPSSGLNEWGEDVATLYRPDNMDGK
jgi:hypothetical protein